MQRSEVIRESKTTRVWSFSGSDAGATISGSGRMKNQVGLGGRGTGIMCRNLSEGRQLEPVKILKNCHSTALIWDPCCHYSPSILIQCPGPIPIWFSSVQSLSRVQLFATPWTAARQASLSSLTPGVCSNPCPSSWWCHPTISPSVIPFSSCLLSFPAWRSFLMSQLFTSDG